MKKHTLFFVCSLLFCLFLHGSESPDKTSLFLLSDNDFLNMVENTKNRFDRQYLTQMYFDHHKKNNTLSKQEIGPFCKLLNLLPNQQEKKILLNDYFKEHDEKNTLDTINIRDVYQVITLSCPRFAGFDRISLFNLAVDINDSNYYFDKFYYARLCINAHQKNKYKNTQPNSFYYLFTFLEDHYKTPSEKVFFVAERNKHIQNYFQHLRTNRCFTTTTENFSNTIRLLPTRQEQEETTLAYFQEHITNGTLQKIPAIDLNELFLMNPPYVTEYIKKYLVEHKKNNYANLSIIDFYYCIKYFDNSPTKDNHIYDFIKNKGIWNFMLKEPNSKAGLEIILSYLQNQQLKNTLAYDCLKKLQITNVFTSTSIIDSCTTSFFIKLFDNESLKHFLRYMKENLFLMAYDLAQINTIPQKYQPFQMAYNLTHIDTFTKDVIDLLLINHTKKEDFFYTPNQADDHCSLVFNELASFDNGGKIALSLLTFCAETEQLFLFEPHHVAQLLELSNLYKGKLSLQDDTIKNKTEIKRIESECASIALSYLNKIKEKDNKPFITGHNCVVFETLLAVIPQEKWCLFFDESMKEIISNKDFPD